MLLLLLLGCPATPDDTGPGPLTVREVIELAPADAGGFDHWDGVALGWAVDPDAGITFVGGAAYEGGTATFDYVPGGDAVETAERWDVEVRRSWRTPRRRGRCSARSSPTPPACA